MSKIDKKNIRLVKYINLVNLTNEVVKLRREC